MRENAKWRTNFFSCPHLALIPARLSAGLRLALFRCLLFFFRFLDRLLYALYHFRCFFPTPVPIVGNLSALQPWQ